jgi:hypothetical protein
MPARSSIHPPKSTMIDLDQLEIGDGIGQQG